MYETIVNIALHHEYYPDGNCPVSLAPTAKTAWLLARYDMLFRKQNANQWLLISQNSLVDDVGARCALPLQFNITATDTTFYYVTRAWKANPAIAIEATNAPKAWQTLTVNIPYLIENKLNEVMIEAESEEKFLEFLCIPKFNGADIPLQMTEEKQRIQVKETGMAALPDGTAARRFVTTEKVKLRQNSGIRMSLWEVHENGERLIGNAIESPLPSQPSPINPKDMITRIYYY
ncbi:MAG: hypothetical protein LBR97_05835 [Dysgonamonadaceae bacterium]|jgi:hypothetical protein|nr:hypothetical protein [Dysgonamonadaceae bacterium]